MLLGQVNRHDFSPIRSWHVALIYWQTFKENHISLDDPWTGGNWWCQKTTTPNSSKRVVLINGSSLWESRPSESRPSVKHVGRDYWKSRPSQIMHIQCYTVLVWALHPCSGVEEIDVNCCQQRLDKPRPNNTMSKVVMVVISKLLDNRGSY